MSTKQIRLLCLVNATDGIAAQLTVSINGIQKFSGLVNQTALAPGEVYDLPINLAQFSVVTIDQDADDITSLPNFNDLNEYSQYWTSGTNEFSATVTGGDVSISLMQADYNGFWYGTPLTWQQRPQSEHADWTGIYCASQPLWNGTANPSIFTYPPDPAQGPCSILVKGAQTVVYQIGLTKNNYYVA